MTAFENLTTAQKLRATLHRDVRALCTETLHLLGLEMTKPAMDIVAELVYRKLSVYATDLEVFAKHAKRNTINSEDVKLLVRRNPSLKTHLSTIQPSNIPAKDKRRKTVAATTSTSKLVTTPVSKPKDIFRPNTEGKKRDGDEKGQKKNLDEDKQGLSDSIELDGDIIDFGEDMDFDETERNLDTSNAGESSSKTGDTVGNRTNFNDIQDMLVEDTIDLTFD